MNSKKSLKLYFLVLSLLLFSIVIFSQKKQFQVISVSGNEITINAGARDGVKQGFTGRTYKESQYEGKTVPIYTAKFEIISVSNNSSKAKITAQTAAIERNQKVEFDQELIPLPQKGTLIINSNPSQATVYLNEKQQGITQLTLSLNPGTYQLKITKIGYKDIIDQVTIKSNQSNQKNYSLEQLPISQEEQSKIVIEEPVDEELVAKKRRLDELKKAAEEAEMAEEAFQAASKLNTIEGWQLFIKDYPNSHRIVEAKKKLEKLKVIENKTNINIRKAETEIIVNKLAEAIKEKEPEEIKQQKKAIPPMYELRIMTNNAVMALAVAINRNDFSGFYDSISRLWQSQTSKYELREIFKEFIKKNIDLTIIENKTPIYKEKPYLDKNELLVLEGYYSTKPYTVNFRLKYIYEYPVWKLFGIYINI
jgi:hypothetical protein